MNLVELAQAGCELRDDAYWFPQMLDFAVNGTTGFIGLRVGWWRMTWQDSGDGLMRYAIPLVPQPDGSWRSGAVELATASDQENQDVMQANHLLADYERDKYLKALAELTVAFGSQFDFGPWTAAFTSRPLRSAAVDFENKNKALREMGRVFLNDESGIADVLVIDEQWNAATAANNTWLRTIANDWSHRISSVRPPLDVYIAWVAGQQPNAAFTLSEPRVFQTDGSVESVAARLLASRKQGSLV